MFALLFAAIGGAVPSSAPAVELPAEVVAPPGRAVKIAESPEVTTAGDLAARLKAASATLLPADALVGVRKRIATEIARELPAEADAALDDATRKKAARLFARIATSLEAAK